MGRLCCFWMLESLRRDGLGGGDVDWREPSEAIGLEAVGDGEELVGDLLGDFAGFAVADDYAVDAADGRDFRSGSGEEDFVGDVEQLARDRLLDYGEAEVA